MAQQQVVRLALAWAILAGTPSSGTAERSIEAATGDHAHAGVVHGARGSVAIAPGAAPGAIDFGVLQFPASLTSAMGTPTALVYGRVFKAGVTESPGASPGIVAQLGYGPDGSDPSTSGSWTWVAATFNLQVGNNDEYMASLTVPSAGAYDYAYRFAYQAGPWLYADLDGSTNGYSTAQAGALAVTVGAIDYGNLQFPATLTAVAGATTDPVYGQVYKLGVTEAPGQGAGIVAQLGYGPDGSDPSTSGSWTWVAATFNVQFQNNDEYVASLTVSTPGTYDYAFRYRYGTGPWLYGDLDGSPNGYSTGQAGSLTVTGSAGVGDGQAPRTRLDALAPNPLRLGATITFLLASPGAAELDVFTVSGQRARALIHRELDAGPHTLHWDCYDNSGRRLPPGTYFLRLSASGVVESRRFAIVH